MNIDWDLVPPNVRPKIPQPLWIEVDGGCWEWQGHRNVQGYGICDPRFYGLPELGSFHRHKTYSGGQYRAFTHRVSYVQNIGPIPDGLIVRHRCDNPSCLRPDHLELGTRADNQRDMQRRGRGRGGADSCKRGHDLNDPSNVRWAKNASSPTGRRRHCKRCEVERGERLPYD
jgi:hypothetical protein